MLLTGGLIKCLSSSPSLSVGFSIPNEAIDVAQSAPQGTHYRLLLVFYRSEFMSDLPELVLTKQTGVIFSSDRLTNGLL